MTISERISTALKEHGLTQKALANLLNVTPSTVCTWVKSNYESIPSTFIMPICRLFDMQPEELLEGQKPQPDEASGADDLSEDEFRLLSIFRNLGWEGKTVVLNTAIQESRRNVGDNGIANSTADVG